MEPYEFDPGFFTRTSLIQLGYGVWANLSQISIGLAYGFQAVTLSQFLAKDSLIKISSSEQPWIATVLILSASLGCLISGSQLDRRGRRIVLVVCQLPMFIGWFYTGFAATAWDIIIGRIITGIGCGMTIVPSRIYSTEISLPNMRGVIGVIPDIAIAIGISIQGVLGSVLLWSTSCYIYGVYAMIVIVSNCFLPETPYYVLLKDNPSQVKRALSKFRSPTYNLDAEIKDLLDFKEDNDIQKKSTCKPFGITSAYFIIAELSGVNIFMLYTIDIISLSKSLMDPYKEYLILALTRLLVAVCTSILLFKLGKKPLAFVSALGVGGTCVGLGFYYLHYNEQNTCIPRICYIAYIAFATMGYYTLPFFIMAEVYPIQVRGFLSGITVSLVYLLMFATNKYFYYVKETLGFSYTLLSFGFSSLFGSLFLMFYLPETKLLMLSDIEEYYNSLRPTLVSLRRVMSQQLKDASSHGGMQTPKSKINIIKASDNAKLSKRSKHNTKQEHDKAPKEGHRNEPKPYVTLDSDSDQDVHVNTPKDKNVTS